MKLNEPPGVYSNSRTTKLNHIKTPMPPCLYIPTPSKFKVHRWDRQGYSYTKCKSTATEESVPVCVCFHWICEIRETYHHPCNKMNNRNKKLVHLVPFCVSIECDDHRKSMNCDKCKGNECCKVQDKVVRQIKSTE